MRILFLLEDYHQFYTRAYAADPGLAQRPFADQCRRLFDQFFYVGDSYADAFSQRGHVAWSVIPHCAPFQAAWAKEHGDPGNGDHVLMQQIAWFQPDCIYFFSGVWLARELIVRMRKGGCTLVLQWSAVRSPEMPYDAFHLVLSTLPAFVEELRRGGIRSACIRHSFDPRVLSRLPELDRKNAAVFIGTLRDRRNNRIQLLERVAEAVELDIYAPGRDEIPAGSPLSAHYRGAAFGLEAYRILAGYQAALHVPGDEVAAYAGARRPFEVAGVGTLLCTQDQPGLRDLYRPGREVVAFRDAGEAARQLVHLLARPAEARRIAGAGQRRTLRDHSMAKAAAHIETAIEACRPGRRRFLPRWFPRRLLKRHTPVTGPFQPHTLA